MIHEHSQLIRKIDHQFQHDPFYPNPNPNSHILLTHHGFFNWPDASTTPLPPQFTTPKKKDLALPSSSPGLRFRSKVFEPQASVKGAPNVASSTASSSGSANMRDPSNRTKVVVRHLPPALTQSTFMEQIESRFAGSFNMVTFYPGKSSIKRSTFTRAYIDFKHPDDVFEFHQAFDGHVFVNEKGTQYKAIVEYAPNQRIPKSWLKKDPREGALLQDPEYLKFVEDLSKPIEFLPSAEVQLERKEAERSSNLAAGIKDPVVVTALMQFVRQKRAMKQMPQKLLSGGGKISIRGGGSSPTASSKMLTKRGSERARAAMYSPGSRSKEKIAYVPRSEDGQRDVVVEKKTRVILEKKATAESSRKITNNNSPNSTPIDDVEQPTIQVILPGKKDSVAINHVPPSDAAGGSNATRNRGGISSLKSPVGSFSSADESLFSKPGRMPRGATSRTPVILQKSDLQGDRDKRVPRSQIWRSNGKDNNGSPSELDPSSSHHYSTNFVDEKTELGRQDGRRLRNKDRPDRPVWTVRRRGDVGSSDSPTSLSVGPSQSPPGNQRQGRGGRESDNGGSQDIGKPTNKRVGSSAAYGGHEKQVWVAKPGSGS